MRRILATGCLLLCTHTSSLAQSQIEIQIKSQDSAGEAQPVAEPTGALEWFKQGVELARGGEHASALNRFRRACQLAPHWALPHLEIAVAHMLTDNDRGIIGKELAEAVRLGSELPRAHYLYGVFLQEAGRRGEAINHLVKALQLRPSLEDARFRLATLYIEEGQGTQGLQQYELLLKQKPNHLGAHRNLAVLLEQAGQLEDAEQHLRHISDLFPTNAYYLSDLARFYQRVGWKDKAKATFQKAERLDPSQGGSRKLRPLPKSRDLGSRPPDPDEDVAN